MKQSFFQTLAPKSHGSYPPLETTKDSAPFSGFMLGVMVLGITSGYMPRPGNDILIIDANALFT